MVKKCLSLIAIFGLLSASTPAWADKSRGCYGPFVLNSANFAPGPAGFNTEVFDGDMTVSTWWRGTGTISFNIEISNFSTAEDVSNASFANTATRTGANVADSIVGPSTRMRFNVTSCTGNCLTSVKVCGRVAP